MAPSTGIDRLLATSAARQQWLATLTPAEQAELAAAYEERDIEYLRLSAAKRARGYGDCSKEWEEASRIASERAALRARTTARRTRTPRVFARKRESRPAGPRRAGSSSVTSGSDPGDPEPSSRRITVDDHYLVQSVVVA